MHATLLYMLMANGVYDIVCGACILFNLPPLNDIHSSCWKNEEDAFNPTARRLMGYLIFAWGGMRLASAAGAGLEWACASFLIEGAIFASETLVFRTMRTAEGMAVALVCLALLFCYSLQLG
jgi:hypothetical protein